MTGTRESSRGRQAPGPSFFFRAGVGAFAHALVPAVATPRPVLAVVPVWVPPAPAAPLTRPPWVTAVWPGAGEVSRAGWPSPPIGMRRACVAGLCDFGR